jgi:cyclopropane fatty-acyl-phospholipid synthase-like methyltransferase
MFRPEGSVSVIKFLSTFNSVLEIGCGYGNIIGAVKADLRVGIDISEIPLKQAQKWHGKRGVNFLQMDVRKLMDHFTKGEFDATVGFDIIEHLTKKEGRKLLDDVQKVATKAHIWFMPAGWMEIHKTDYDDGNDYMLHKSAWEPEEMAERGYEVWHYADWFKEREKKYETTTIRGMFAIKLRKAKHNPGSIHRLLRYPKIHHEQA